MSRIDFEEESRMHDFCYNRKGELCCENVPLRKILEKTGTPAYIYSSKTLTDHLAKLQRAFRSVRPLICYSVKANSNLAVLRALVAKGSGLDIVSGGELFRARKVKCQGRKIVYAGVGKKDEEIREAIRARILLFNVESVPELERINALAKKMRKKVNVSLRINPNVDPHTHDYITTGKAETKFGIDFERARAIYLASKTLAHARLTGVHVHIGSQIETGEPFFEAFRKILEFIDEIEAAGMKIRFLNLGGGLGIIYSDEDPQTADEFASKILPLLRKRKFGHLRTRAFHRGERGCARREDPLCEGNEREKIFYYGRGYERPDPSRVLQRLPRDLARPETPGCPALGVRCGWSHLRKRGLFCEGSGASRNAARRMPHDYDRGCLRFYDEFQLQFPRSRLRGDGEGKLLQDRPQTRDLPGPGSG